MQAAASACVLAACSGGDHGGLRPATRDSGEELGDASGGEDAGSLTGAATPDVQRWVGEVDGTDVRIGAVIDRERARIFFCGGPNSYMTATRWITVDLAGDGSYRYDENDWQVSGRVERAEIHGELRRGEADSAQFRAEPIAPNTLAGLYEGQSDCGRLGLIVVQRRASDEPAAQGACVGAGHPPEQVNPILPISITGGEIRVKVGDVEAGVREASLTSR